MHGFLPLRPRQCHGGAVGRVENAGLLANHSARRRGSRHGIGPGHVSVQFPVHPENLEFAALSVAAGNLVVNGKFLEDLSQGGVLGAGHGREQVVFQLVLHAAPEPFRKGVGHHGTSCGLELGRDPIGLVFVEHFFRLVGGRDDEGAQKTGRKDRGQPHLDGEEREQPGVVDEEGVETGFGSGPLFPDARDSHLEGIDSPEGKQKAKGDVKDPVLNLANGAVVFGGGCPLEQKGIRSNILVTSLFVR